MADKVIVCETPDALAEKVAQEFTALVEETLKTKERMTIALAGGLTPKLFYARLAEEPYRSRLPWDKLRIFWGDERCVPKDHPESNYGMAFDTLLSRVPIASAYVTRIKGEEPPPVAAKEYETQLRTVFAGRPWPELWSMRRKVLKSAVLTWPGMGPFSRVGCSPMLCGRCRLSGSR
jgi:6-phosphogluconolactonase